MEDPSGEFSDGLDEFEESIDEKRRPPIKSNTAFKDKPYDEAYELSQDLSMAESFDGRDKQPAGGAKEKLLKNHMYDEAVEVSQSIDQSAMNVNARPPNQRADAKAGPTPTTDAKGNDSKAAARPAPSSTASEDKDQRGMSRTEGTRSQSLLNNRFDERKSTDETVSDDGDHEESYDHIEGAYNPRDYMHLNITSDVKELFMYIERYKPQEVDLDTPLKCFIPEYIPAIGELDPFLKIPRPDGKDDGSGLKYLDEPASNQSDPTVLELQLRAKSKKLQYSDVAVRSIEYADKNPAKIEKWIQDINDLHRTKPPPHVNYRRNMPDIDRLMEVWPEDFEKVLSGTPLPSPDLDLSLAEYAKVLCSILDIPVYDNPIESLHLLFSLFVEFKNNPHFQNRIIPDPSADGKEGGGGGGAQGSKYGGADVLELDN
eukprot:gene15399-11007_t